MRFKILCIKHTHKLFLSFFPFFSFFVLFSFFLLFLLGFVCWALLSVYTGHIFQGRPSVVPYSVSSVAKGGGGMRRRRRLRPRLCLSPSARFGSALFIKKKQQKYVGKNKKCFVLSGLRFCSILFGATTKKFYLCPIYESGNALACVCVCAYFLLTS